MSKIISSAELKKDRSIYNHKTKWCKNAIGIDDHFGIKKLALAIDFLAYNNERNEKIGVTFRTCKVEGDLTTIMDIAPTFERNADDSLIDSKTFLDYAKQYADYVKNTKELSNLMPEVIYYYYALDLKSGKDEMPDDDFLIERSYPLNANERKNLALTDRLGTLGLIADKVVNNKEDFTSTTNKPKTKKPN